MKSNILKIAGRSLLLSLCLTAFAASADQIILNWQASSDSAISGYYVYYGTSSGNYSVKLDNKKNTSITISNLLPGMTYYFTATTYDSHGDESAPAGEVAYSIPGFSILPTLQNKQVILKFPAASGHWYEIQASTDLKNWISVCQTPVTTQDTSIQFSDPQTTQFSHRFYRLATH